MKGQAWAEYIIILAVVVTMAAIAMYIAGGFMGTNQQISERDSAAYWASADVAITRYYVNSSASQLVIKNNKNFRINVTAISSGGSGNLIASGGAKSIILDPGQSAQVNVTSLNCSGGVYSLVLIVNYTDARYGTKYSLYGEKPLVGLCTNYYAPPQCTSDADCQFDSIPCNNYCNVSLSQLCTFTTNPATCQMTCNGGKCLDCQPSCGTASCASCGANTTNCPAAYCNGNQNCTYPPSTSCSIPCPGGDACGSCNTPACMATCANCPPSAQICTGNGNCVACNNNGTCDTSLGENYTNCPADCCRGGMYSCSDAGGTCRSGCSGFNCLNFKQVCDNQPWTASRCSNSTGGSSGSLDYYVGGCCNGTVYYCGDGRTCNQTSSSTTSCITKTAYYQSSTNLCGYYNGTSASCGSANNFCAAGTYYPSQSCSATPAYTSCQAETAANSCAVCGNCTGGSDTCSPVACGLYNYSGCSNYCNGSIGASACNSKFANGHQCSCNEVCQSNNCVGGTCQAITTYYKSGTSLCGYYNGTSASCSAANNFCAAGTYYPSQACSATPTYTSCQTGYCAVCGDCTGTSDNCSIKACGTTGYGCAGGNVCNGQGTGAGNCVAAGGTGATCYCNETCISGVCTGGVCKAKYQSSTNLCGYYNGTSASCGSANNFCAAGTYYPSQSCSGSPTYTACTAETPSASCAICGNCAGGADTCNNVTCGITNNYGCGSGMYCSGAKGAGSCNAPFANGHACNCSLQCTSGTCASGVCATPVTCPNGACDNGETYLTCPADCCASNCAAKTSGGGNDGLCHYQCAGINGCVAVQDCDYSPLGSSICDSTMKKIITCCAGTVTKTCTGSNICCDCTPLLSCATPRNCILSCG